MKIPARPASVELTVKKSRFIACAAAAVSREQALGVVAQAREKYPDAGHYCWAYLLGDPRSPISAAMSDDGEPSGTAGRPILNVLQHKDIGNIVIVVSRYFGGIKLGAGGLVRAYSSAAQSVVDALSLSQHISTIARSVRITFAQEQDLRHWLDQNHGRIIAIHYDENVIAGIEIPEDKLGAFASTSEQRNWTIVATDQD